MNRKSTRDKEDQQVLSIQGQNEENLRRLQREGHEVVKIFNEERSAKEPGRPLFAEMVSMLERGEADGIACWRLNRLARNPIDGGRIQWMLQQGIIKLINTSEKTYIPSDNVIQMSVEFGMATQYSIDLGKDVKRGMLQKAKQGWRPGIAPVGYMNDYAGIKGEKMIYPDPERFPLVRKCWDMLLTKSYTVQEIHKIALKEFGLTVQVGRKAKTRPIGLNTLYEAFGNPFYCGHFSWGGQEWTGSHAVMITEEEFERAQEILGSRTRSREYGHQNPYPDLLRCGHCGRSIVLEEKNKKMKTDGSVRTYQYLRCSKNCSKLSRLTKLEVDEQLSAFVKTVFIPDSFLQWAIEKLKLSKADRLKQREADRNRLEQSRRDSEKKINDLLDLRLTKPQLFSDEAFQRKMQSLEQELMKCEEKVVDCDGAQRTWRDDFIDHLIFVEKLQERFRTGTLKVRLEILHRLGQSLELKDGAVVCRLAEPYSTLVHGLKTKAPQPEALGNSIQERNEPSLTGMAVSEGVVEKWSRLLEDVRTVLSSSRSMCP